ncbi:hypothetical protein ACIREO_05720 [Streptomyces sp. NPDC102441]
MTRPRLVFGQGRDLHGGVAVRSRGTSNRWMGPGRRAALLALY